jgi:hypothetical protein
LGNGSIEDTLRGGRDRNTRRIENNPMVQEARFAPVTARFFRFTALTAIKGFAGARAAEIGVMPVDADIGH